MGQLYQGNLPYRVPVWQRAGTLGSRKFDNGLEIINLAAGKPDGKVALMGKRCVLHAHAHASCVFAPV